MFKRTRIRIVAAIMSVLAAVWVASLGIIYFFSYTEMSHRNREMLEAEADMYSLLRSDGQPPPDPRPENTSPSFKKDYSKSPAFQLSVFYSVALDYDGRLLEIKNDRPAVHTDESLESLAQSIASGKEETGTVDNLLFRRTDKNGYLLVTFMDNTVINENAATLLRYTAIFGCIALVLFFFVSVVLARKIVAPIEESYEKQKRFISDAGHELKTPVSVVGANAELLQREVGNNRWLENIRYENEKMGLLVSQLLELARTENVRPTTEPLELGRLVAGEALPFESVAFEKGQSLKLDIQDGIYIDGNAAALKQLVSILLDNAISHSKGKGDISVSLEKRHRFCVLSVKNKGDELSGKDKKHIFDRFYRADPARNGEASHYGLGLSIAKAVAEAHFGTISVHCDNGEVEFKVQLPLK